VLSNPIKSFILKELGSVEKNEVVFILQNLFQLLHCKDTSMILQEAKYVAESIGLETVETQDSTKFSSQLFHKLDEVLK
jgi:hypothetical protein